MPKEDPYDWVRVKDSKSGHTYTARRLQAEGVQGLQILKQDAVDVGGNPLAPEYGDDAAKSKES